MFRKNLLLIFIFISLAYFPNAQVLYVDGTRTADGDGASWSTAYKSLHNALVRANADNNIWQICVTGGARVTPYSPQSGNPNNTFLISRGGLKLTGGYAPGGSADPVPGKTSVLEGNQSVYHIMVIAGLGADASEIEISGFTFSGGRAGAGSRSNYNGVSVPNNSGGGIVVSGNDNLEKIIFSHCEIRANYAGNTGAGVYVEASVPVFRNCLFWGNYADYGGAAFNYANSHTRYINCTISGNHDNHGGGGMRNSNSDPIIANTIIYGNDGGIANNDGASPVISTSLVQGIASTNNGNLNGNATDPVFESPLPMPINSTPPANARVDYRLKPGSPCINKGATTPYTVNGGDLQSDNDFWGSPRMMSETIDIGASEGFAVSAAGIVYVKKGSRGAGDNWLNAMGELADAVRLAKTSPAIKQIWVAAGTYKPMYSYIDEEFGLDKGSENALLIVRDLKIYGGFSGGETNIAARNWKINETVISGDLDNSNTPGEGDANHLVVRVGSSQNAILDGFTLTGAYNMNEQDQDDETVNGVTYVWNGTGGAILISRGSMTVNNCIIADNSGFWGGGIGINTTNENQVSVFRNCLITRNQSKVTGGGISMVDAYATFINCAVTENKAGHSLPGIEAARGQTIFINSTIANNGQSYFYRREGLTSPPHLFYNCIFWDYILNSYAASAIFNSIMKDGSSEVFIRGDIVAIGEGNIDSYRLSATDLFVDYVNGDYTLKPGSPLVNAGNNSFFENLGVQTRDLAGNKRLWGPKIDVGAYEYQGADALPVLFGHISATLKDNRLLVNWITETESNNDHFLLQLSSDGVNFKTIQTIKSKASDGNSSEPLEYSSAISFPALTAAGLLFLAFSMVRASAPKIKYRVLLFLLGAISFGSCQKRDLFKSVDDGKLFVRIIQVDKDGTETASKIIAVVKE